MDSPPGEAQVEEIAAALRSLSEAGVRGQVNRLVVQGGAGWAVLIGIQGERHVDCELAANAHLPEETRLGADQLLAMQRDGFIPPFPRSERRHQVLHLPDPAQATAAARQLVGWMQRLYGAEDGALRLELQPGQDADLADLDNAALWAAMRTASRDRSQESRLALYRALINATFLLAVASPGSEEPLCLEMMGPWPVFAAFTDATSLRAHDPRGLPRQRLYGHELFPRLMRTPIGALKINPGGEVGGELYRNEIETLANAVRRFSSSAGR